MEALFPPEPLVQGQQCRYGTFGDTFTPFMEQKISTHTALRSRKREQRNALDDSIQASHAIELANRVCKLPRFRNAQRIACYLANDGEIDPTFIIEQAWSMTKQVLLPVLAPLNNSLVFAPYTPQAGLSLNRFSIPEPNCRPGDHLKAQQVDLMLVPLVAFDEQGNRLGMGGGFYDRTLAYLKHRSRWKKPYLIGLAHELQKTDHLHARNWDIPLDAIATEAAIYII